MAKRTSLSLLLILATALLSSGPGFSQKDEQAWKVADERAKQIKSSMNQFERKLSWHIFSMLQELEAQNVTKANVNINALIKRYESPIMQLNDSGKILCHIWLKDALPKGILTNVLENIEGVQIVNSKEPFKFVVAYVPFYSFMEVAKASDVRFVDPATKAVTKSPSENPIFGEL